ncbi:MAG: hypothetical protein ABSB29_02045 [Nitrososphaerales archaeon]|jgi:hypothetical protein
MNDTVVFRRVGAEKRAENSLRSKLKESGPGRSVDLFLNRYGNIRTKATYAIELALFLRWLKQKDIRMTPDELVKDNLVCVFKSDPIDAPTKRRQL